MRNNCLLLFLIFTLAFKPVLSSEIDSLRQNPDSLNLNSKLYFEKAVIDSMKMEFISFAETSTKNLIPGYGYYKNGENLKAWIMWIGIPVGLTFYMMGANHSTKEDAYSGFAEMGFGATLLISLPIIALIDPIFSTPQLNRQIISKWREKYPEIINKWEQNGEW